MTNIDNFYGSPNALHNTLYGNFRQRIFTDIWGTLDAFLKDYKDCPIPKVITDDNAKTLYYLLYAKYGNSTIASSDENQFKYKCFSIIYSAGPTWEKKLEIQKRLRDLKETNEDGTPGDLILSASTIYNQAANPSTEPSTQDTEELPYINNQNVSKHKRSIIDAYGFLNSLLEEDLCSEFLERFKVLFISVVAPSEPLWYVMDVDEEEGG